MTILTIEGWLGASGKDHPGVLPEIQLSLLSILQLPSETCPSCCLDLDPRPQHCDQSPQPRMRQS